MGELPKKVNGLFNNKADGALKVTTICGQPVHIVDATNPRSIKLLAEAYKDVYEPAFPLPEERETLENWVNKITKGKQENSTIVLALVVENINAENPTVKGISVGYYYNKVAVGLMAYVAIAPEYRNEGLGRVMVEARKHAFLDLAKSKGSQLKGVFLECNDPEKVKPEDDSFDPATRIKIFQKWGAKVMPIDYVQPPLEIGADKCTKFKLLAYPHPETGQYPAPDDIKAYIEGIYTSCAKYYGCAPEQNPDYIKIMQQIATLRQDNTPPKNKPPFPGKPGF
ncbi:MAG: hypothetical protein K8R48_08640 [Alphaproteobacteria bacterium]|nr:hypothetical protein [Alphaproteobacteria bacterium]